MANFYTILTEVGKAKIANSQVTGKKIDLSEMAIGDGKGELYDPVDSQIELKNEVWRGSVGSIEIDSDNPNWIVMETIIPAETGGFTVREAGLFDETGDLIAIGKYPETYKPVLDEGSAKDLYIRMIIEVTNSSSVTLKIDPAVTIASRKYVDEKFEQVSYPVTSVNDKTGNVKLTAEDVGAETPEKSTEKANTAEQNANNYTDEAKKQLQSEIADTSKKDRKYTDDQVGKVEVPVTSVNDKTGAVTITKTDVGLENVRNVKQASKEEHDNLQKEVTSHKVDYATHVEDETAHGIGDKSTLETTEKSTIVGALNELFTNVSDGKKLIGGAITDVDENVVIPTDATFQQLADLIGKAAGEMKKWAEGNHETTERKGNSSFSIFYMPPVVFSPSIIILHAVNRGKVFVFEKTAEEWANIGAGDGRDPKGGKDDFSAVIAVPLNTDIHWLAFE